MLAIAFAARARLFPFSPSVDEPARALTCCAALVALARFPFGDVSDGAPWIAVAFAGASLVASARALANRSVPSLFAAELAIAGAGCSSSAPAFGVMHAFVAAIMFARGRAPKHDAAHALLLPTRIGVAAALSPVPCGAILAASLLASCALGQHRARTTRLVAIVTFGAAAITFGAFFIAPQFLTTSFRVSPDTTMPSIALAGLVSASVAFAWGTSRSRALDRLARASLIKTLAGAATIPARATHATGVAVAAALHELDARLSSLVHAVDRAIRGVAALTSFFDGAIASATARALPLPSERVVRWLLVVVTLSATVLFAVPWLS